MHAHTVQALSLGFLKAKKVHKLFLSVLWGKLLISYHVSDHKSKVIWMSPATAFYSNSNMSQWHVIITETDLSTRNTIL